MIDETALVDHLFARDHFLAHTVSQSKSEKPDYFLQHLSIAYCFPHAKDAVNRERKIVDPRNPQENPNTHRQRVHSFSRPAIAPLETS